MESRGEEGFRGVWGGAEWRFNNRAACYLHVRGKNVIRVNTLSAVMTGRFITLRGWLFVVTQGGGTKTRPLLRH